MKQIQVLEVNARHVLYTVNGETLNCTLKRWQAMYPEHPAPESGLDFTRPEGQQLIETRKLPSL